MKCGQCNADLVEGAQFCAICGTRVAIASASPVVATPSPAPMAAIPAPPPAVAAPPVGPPPAVQAAAPALKTVSGVYIAYLACAAILIVSAFLKWETLSVSGVDVKSETGFGVVRGALVFIAAIIAAGIVVASMTRVEPMKWLRLAQLGAAVVAIGMAGLEFALVGNNACPAGTFACSKPTAGIGALTALVGGVALLAVALFKGGSPKPAAAPLSEDAGPQGG